MNQRISTVMKRFAVIPLCASLTVASVLSGCAAAVLGGAGAAGGIAYTDRGAKGEVKGNVDQVNQAAQSALQSMNIQVTGNEMKNSGQERTLAGKSGQAAVTVNMTQAGTNTTHVEVIAKEETFKWNKDYAKEILAKIVNQR
jgi:hypothetical protein